VAVTRLSDEHVAELFAQSVPEVTSALVAQRYDFGARQAAVLCPVRSSGPNGIAHAFVLLSPTAESVELAFWAEQDRLASFTGVGSHRLICLQKRCRTTLDQSDQWAELRTFEANALVRARELTRADPSIAATATDTDGATDADTDADAAAIEARTRAQAAARLRDRSARRARDRRAHRSGGVNPAAAGAGALGFFLILIKIGLKLAMCGSHLDAPSLPPNPAHVLRMGGPDGGLGDATIALDNTGDPVAMDSSDVYWVSKSDEQLLAQSIANGYRRVLGEQVHNPTGIALDQTHAYVTCAAGKGAERAAAVVRIPKTGGAAERLAWAMAAPAAPVVRGGYVYFVDALPGVQRSRTHSAHTLITRVPIEAGQSQRFLEDVELAPALAVSDTEILWLPWGEQELRIGLMNVPSLENRLPRVIRLAPLSSQGPGNRPTGLALAGETAWVTLAAGEHGSFVQRIALDSDEAKLVLVGQGRIRDLMADGEWLWWVEEAAGRLDADLCAARPGPGKPPARHADGGAETQSPDASALSCAVPATHAGLETVHVAAHLPRGTHIAVGSSRVYWTTGNGVAWASKDERADQANTP